MNFVFFGTDNFALTFLEELKRGGIIPSLVICGEDKPKGRGLKLTHPPVKLFAQENSIPFIQPQKLDASLTYQLTNLQTYQLFVVASYGQIIPKEILNIPELGSLNIHPSLLPKLRGASPIQGLILQNETPGVTIIKMDEKMDHGPIIVQRELKIKNWPIKASSLSPFLAQFGAKLFAEILPDFLAGIIKEKPQNHDLATFTKKINKEDGLIDLNGNPESNYRKFLAYDIWPGSYFFTEISADRRGLYADHRRKKIRIKITDAEFRDGKFIIKKIIPEGKKETEYKNC